MDLIEFCNKCGYSFPFKNILKHIKTCKVESEKLNFKLKDIYEIDDDDYDEDYKINKTINKDIYIYMKPVDICPYCSKSYSYKSIERHLKTCKLREQEKEKLNINLKNDDYEKRMWKININKQLSDHFYQWNISTQDYNNEFVVINNMSCFIDGIDD